MTENFIENLRELWDGLQDDLRTRAEQQEVRKVIVSALGIKRSAGVDNRVKIPKDMSKAYYELTCAMKFANEWDTESVQALIEFNKSYSKWVEVNRPEIERIKNESKVR